MSTLVNLHELGIKLQSEFESLFTPDDFELPDSFKNAIKELSGYKYDYKQCLVHIHSDNLNGYIPNQWFVIASFFVEYYLELQKYKNLLIECLTKCGYNNTEKRKSIMSIYSTELSKKPKTEDLNQYKSRIVNNIREVISPKLDTVDGLDPSDKDLLVCFISDYDWWFGGKSIDRGDFYISPILYLAKVINASHSYIAEICKALADNKEAADSLKDFYKKERQFSSKSITFIALPLQTIFYGAPGTGKSHYIKEATKDFKDKVIRTTFHPDSDYSTFVGSYKPTTKEVILRDLSGHRVEEDGKYITESKIVYEFVNQAFLKAYINAWKFYADAVNDDPVQKQFLVIEEINRGNCAQIFGDLFQLLDRNDYGFSDYPINADADMQKQLQKAFAGLHIEKEQYINAMFPDVENIVRKVLNGDVLVLPNNLYIWATMNTSDQSLFPIDSAFKRRWDWQYMPIFNANKGYVIQVGDNAYDWWEFLGKINTKIDDFTHSEDKKLGYFFCKAKEKVINLEMFVGKVIFYLWNDVFKDFELEDSIFNDTDGSKLSFNKFYITDSDGNTSIASNKVDVFMKNLGISILIPDDTEETGSGKLSIIYNGETINEEIAIDTFVKAIEMIGIDRVADLNLKVSDFLLFNTEKPTKETHGGYASGLRQLGVYWMITKYDNNAKVRYIKKIQEAFDLDLKASIE